MSASEVSTAIGKRASVAAAKLSDELRRLEALRRRLDAVQEVFNRISRVGEKSGICLREGDTVFDMPPEMTPRLRTAILDVVSGELDQVLATLKEGQGG